MLHVVGTGLALLMGLVAGTVRFFCYDWFDDLNHGGHNEHY